MRSWKYIYYVINNYLACNSKKHGTLMGDLKI